MRRPYITPSRDVARMEFVCGFRLGHGYVCYVRLDGVSAHAPAIRRSIWSDLLCFLGHDVGHMCIPELLCLSFYGEVVRDGVWLELPLFHGHVVVGQPHYSLVGRAPAPHQQIGVTIFTSGSFWLGARGRIPWPPGPQSICQGADLDQLEAATVFSSGSL